ncbi:UTP-glucose-1-phosphate uridylyltransferase [Spraguea lophii 42_110]|uniref:UTP--glucose-1-phosphate uridylyltransferase n=1 Tax=Spraguea lophii (strain 42_110) TaxID=1358809 RepID=S7WDU3_SPRLO|nr:UTP-glucose-1-phosphate uridylyltransferase [Spraguea lophii 42_110]
MGDNNHILNESSSCSEKRIDYLLEAIKTEIDNIKQSPDNTSTDQNLDEFYDLYERYLRTKDNKICWKKKKPPMPERIVNYEDIENGHSLNHKELLGKLAVLKLNGGLGTTMGCVGPKSAIKVKEDKNFLNLCAKQIDHLHKKYGVCVPLILMNSFNTEKQTKRMISRYKGIKTFTQSAYPRISADSLLPLDIHYGKSAFYPPGHGDIFNSLKNSGVLDELLNEGKEYLFVSNIDNLAATVDFNILEYFIKNDVGFLMEVTEKTRADIKGGTLIEYDGTLNLLELAQVPLERKTDFTSVRKFKIFNTNSIWINLKAMKKLLDEKTLEADIIENKKKVQGIDEVIIQLETAIGAAIKYFPNAKGIVVPRRRFLPVKTCSDLFLVQSNLFLEKHGTLVLNPKRPYPTIPLVKLIGVNFKNVNIFIKSFKGKPDIIELDHLTVSGNVKFGKGISLKGSVIIIADENSTIVIPDGSVLEDNIVYGNLPIIEH